MATASASSRLDAPGLPRRRTVSETAPRRRLAEPRLAVGIGRRHRTAVLCALILAGAYMATLGHAGGLASRLTVLAANLDNPRKIALGPGGTVYVVEAGSGGNTARRRCLATCVGDTGAIVRVDHGVVTPVVTGLGSVAGPSALEAEGPAAVLLSRGRYDVLMQDMDVTPAGVNPLGLRDAGDLILAGSNAASAQVVANLARFEAIHNPDHGAGPGPKFGDPIIDSDPYAMVAYRGGFAIVDASADDLLWLRPDGHISVLAVFPTQREVLTAAERRDLGPHAPSVLNVRSVPTCVTVGPQGALYVGELTGWPYQVGKARIWRVLPGHRPELDASGFTTVIDLAYDRADLLVLEIDSRGLLDPTAPGALIRVAPDGARTLVASAGLDYPTGIAVGNGLIYISNNGIYPGSGSERRGELVTLPAKLGA